MKLGRNTLCALLGVFAMGLGTTAAVAADRPYTEGAVMNVSAIRTAPGMFDEYMKYVAGPYKQMMDAQKAAGVIVSWSAYSTTPSGPDDPNLYLITVYKNMAAMDGLDAKTDPISEKVFGSMDKSNAAAVDREKIRKLMGDELLRELIVK